MSELSQIDHNGEVLEVADEAARERISTLEESHEQVTQSLEGHEVTRANETNAGHVQLSDSVGDYSGVESGKAATPLAIKTAYDKAETAESIAKGRNQSLSYRTYEDLVAVLNAMEANELNVGQNIYIGIIGVPDLWIYSIVADKVEYTYTSDDDMVSEIETNTMLQIGHYCVAFLEGQKVDLTSVNEKIQTNRNLINSINNALPYTVVIDDNAGTINFIDR